MEALLDFSKDFDVALLDQVVDMVYGGKGSSADIKAADQVLNGLRAHPDSWTRSAGMLQNAKNPQSKYLALQILDSLIKTRWKTLATAERQGIRNFVGTLCMEWSSDPSVFESQRALLNKADLTLVEVLKQEWPQHWPEFIPDIVASSHAGLEVCENNMTILKLLAEEVFDFSANQMTQTKAQTLKQQLVSEFSEIFKLCHDVLEKASRPSLILATLNTLSKYLSWIPPQFIFETNFIELLITKLLTPFEFRNATIKCLTEVAALEVPQYESQLVTMFRETVNGVTTIVPLEADLTRIYASAQTTDQDFIQNWSLFLAIFLTHHVKLIEAADSQGLLQQAHAHLLNISQIEEREVFKGCLDYWAKLVVDLYDEIKMIPSADITDIQNNVGGLSTALPAMLSGGAIDPKILSAYPLRTHAYSAILAKLRVIVIDHMVRPEEVRIEENEEGEVVRVAYGENDTTTLYKSLRDVLVFLTHLDVDNTEEIMKEKLERQIDDSEWSWHKINTLCWAIGSISGTMNVQTEKHFLVHVIKRLLELTEQKRGKDNKAIVASNIMYIVGQYPRFLRTRAHWTFLKTVVNKLFEFMHELHEGVQDMACDTFMKISLKCRLQFIEPRPDEPQPFIEVVISQIEKHTSDLQPHQVQQFYEACGCIISALRVKNLQIRYIEELMRFPNMAWKALIQQYAENEMMLGETEALKILINLLKTNTAVCNSLGAPYETQLAYMYTDLLGLYQLVSKHILTKSQENATYVHTHEARLLRSFKREALRLVEAYLQKAEDLQQVAETITPPLLSTILDDYRSQPPKLRECEVLKCVTIVVEKVGGLISHMVLGILENVFENTLEMLSEDLTEYPEFRVGFFTLLSTINEHSFETLLQLPQQIFASTINACLWASKHDNRDVESAGLSVTKGIVVNVIKLNNPVFINSFFKSFTKLILGDTFGVLTDPDHRSGFILQSDILALFLDVAESDIATAPIYEEGEAEAGTSNGQYLRAYLTRSLKMAFPHLNDQQLTVFVQGMFTLYKDLTAFRSHLRDFLIQIKEFGNDDVDYLYAEERVRQLEEQQRLKREQDLKIGGLIKPSDRDDDDIDGDI